MALPFHQPNMPHLGTGWSFPIRVNVQGQIMFSSGYRNVEESIFIILRTTIGERIGLTQFGSDLEEMAFDSLNSSTLVLLRIAVEEALQRWEPRIHLQDVEAMPDPIQGRVNLNIRYRVHDNYDVRSLVYPFYLQPVKAEETQPAAAPVYGSPV